MDSVYDAKTFDAQSLANAYHRDGYVLLKGVFSSEEVRSLQDETLRICRGDRGKLFGADLINRGASSAEEAMQQVLAIHFPHKVSSIMKATLTQSDLVRALNTLIGPDIKCMQSMLFVKNAGKPGQAWHQDEHYIPTRDRSLAGIWIALDDARVDNGGLWMHPGSHKHGVIWPTRQHNDPRFDTSQEAYDYPYEREAGVSLDADAGDAVVFHGYVLHRSLNNTRTSGYRRALVNHVMSARSMLPWAMGIPPKPKEDFRDFEMVSGEDHYAWKGREDITVPFLRPEDSEQAMQVYGELFEFARSSS
ncbi:MAG: phytanoyl-CoA dioxygenase family protein [Pseudomonadota bacterium]